GLACRTVANDELALAAANRNHRVDCLDASLDGGVHALAQGHAGGDALNRPSPAAINRTFAVDRFTKRVHDTPDKLFADGHLNDATGRADLVALFNVEVFAEDDRTDRLFFEVHGDAHGAVGELKEL